MKLLLLQIIFCLFSNFLYSQEKLSVSASINPIISNRNLLSLKNSVNRYETNDNYIKNRNAKDENLFGFKAEMCLNAYLNSRFGLYLGLGYTFQKIAHSFQFTPQSMYYIPDFVSNVAKYQYLSIPIGVLINIKKLDKFTFAFHCGLALDYLIDKKDMDTELGVYTYSCNRYVIDSNFGIYCNYSFSNHLELLLKPNFSYSLTPNIVDFSAISQHNYCLGLEVGIKYKIN